jgi:hypothetical protein
VCEVGGSTSYAVAVKGGLVSVIGLVVVRVVGLVVVRVIRLVVVRVVGLVGEFFQGCRLP